MPCNCDHLEPTARERAFQKAAKLLLLVNNYFGWSTTTQHRLDVENQYCSHDYVEELCTVMQNLDERQRDGLLYSDARNKPRRELATWWEDHQEEDRQRVQRELDAAQKKKDKEAAIAKLTPYERKLLGL
jgi:hypothetical protein